jgi:ribonuclease HI
LSAILRALELTPNDRDVQVVTDSKYSIDCVTVWYKNWERNNWQTSLKQDVLNKDLIQAVLAKIREREVHGTATKFLWVKGHSKEPGNEAADQLAVLGAQKPRMG